MRGKSRAPVSADVKDMANDCLWPKADVRRWPLSTQCRHSRIGTTWSAWEAEYECSILDLPNAADSKGYKPSPQTRKTDKGAAWRPPDFFEYTFATARANRSPGDSG